MTEVINFFFQTLTDVLNVILQYWILSVSLLITIFSWIISIINQSKGSNR